MGPPRFVYQCGLVVLVCVFLMLCWLWPNDAMSPYQPIGPTQPARRKRSKEPSRVLERIVDREPFDARRRQQHVIRRDKEGGRHPPLVHQALHGQGTGQPAPRACG